MLPSMNPAPGAAPGTVPPAPGAAPATPEPAKSPTAELVAKLKELKEALGPALDRARACEQAATVSEEINAGHESALTKLCEQLEVGGEKIDEALEYLEQALEDEADDAAAKAREEGPPAGSTGLG